MNYGKVYLGLIAHIKNNIIINNPLTKLEKTFKSSSYLNIPKTGVKVSTHRLANFIANIGDYVFNLTKVNMDNHVYLQLPSLKMKNNCCLLI